MPVLGIFASVLLRLVSTSSPRGGLCVRATTCGFRISTSLPGWVRLEFYKVLAIHARISSWTGDGRYFRMLQGQTVKIGIPARSRCMFCLHYQCLQLPFSVTVLVFIVLKHPARPMSRCCAILRLHSSQRPPSTFELDHRMVSFNGILMMQLLLQSSETSRFNEECQFYGARCERWRTSELDEDTTQGPEVEKILVEYPLSTQR